MARTPGTSAAGRCFAEDVVEEVWNKAQVVQNNDPTKWRKDHCGAWIQRRKHGDCDSQYGWEIDHITAVANGGNDDLDNLQPLQWENNRFKSDKVDAKYCRVQSSHEKNIKLF